MVSESRIEWLLDSDSGPTLRWQVERDLVGAPPAVWEATRAWIAAEGDGARLLALQDPDGQWAGSAYFPADFDYDGRCRHLQQPMSLRVIPRRRENGVGSPADADTSLG